MTPTDIITHGARQLEIMGIIWREGRPVSVQYVVDSLNETRRAKEHLAYTTVLTMMRNLYKRNTLDRGGGGRSHQYWAVEDEATFKTKYLSAVNSLLFQGDTAAMKRTMKAVG